MKSNLGEKNWFRNKVDPTASQTYLLVHVHDLS